MNRNYILDGHDAVPADLTTWARWYEKADRRVAHTDTGNERISTVFLGLNHSFGGGPPLLFETLVFSGPLDGEMDRYSTWIEAESGHAKMVARCGAAQPQDHEEAKP